MQVRYKPFIVLSEPRSGSNYLIHLLNNHPSVLCYGEIFQPEFHLDNPGPTVFDYFGVFKVFRLLRSTFPLFFVRHLVFKKHRASLKAVGFKIFYEHASKGKPKDIWSYLRSLEDLRVLHLKRKNALRIIVSRKLAEKTGVYYLKKDQKGETNTLKLFLDYKECLKFFKRLEAQRLKYDSFFKKHKILQIYYEDLVKHKRLSENRICDFLDVKKRPLKCKLARQNTRSLRRIIVNYDSLKRKFSKTPWKRFFV